MTNMEWMLVGQAKKGDPHAFARLYEKYYKDLYRFALCMTRNSHAAEDVVSEAVVRAYEGLRKLRKDSSFKSWIFQITANEARKAMKGKSFYLEDESLGEEATEEAGYGQSELAELLDHLNEEERLVVTLSVFAGYTSGEIAGAIGKADGSVRSIKSRAFAKLRKVLEAQEGSDFHE
ncbi:MAG: sigma-70 family RNA polymerase sigma factor [Eubacterium sp.]|nr:sigma-70 family RNA polymerase sigma factor [Eubacterium sp.]